MKSFVVLLTVFTGWNAWGQDTTKVQPGSEGRPEIEFEEVEWRFQPIMIEEKVIHVFTFANTGNAPLHLSNVTTSCGCTTPEWPKQPIKPGEKGEIKVVFDSSGKPGYIEKSIRVHHNGKGRIEHLNIKGFVKTH